jgi:hypothetical protein
VPLLLTYKHFGYLSGLNFYHQKFSSLGQIPFSN